MANWTGTCWLSVANFDVLAHDQPFDHLAVEGRRYDSPNAVNTHNLQRPTPLVVDGHTLRRPLVRLPEPLHGKHCSGNHGSNWKQVLWGDSVRVRKSCRNFPKIIYNARMWPLLRAQSIFFMLFCDCQLDPAGMTQPTLQRALDWTLLPCLPHTIFWVQWRISAPHA